MSIGSEIRDEMIIRQSLIEGEIGEARTRKCWITNDGKMVPVKDLDDGHLMNIHRRFQRDGFCYPITDLRTVIENEVSRRFAS